MAFSHLSDFWSAAQLAGVSGWSTAKPTVSLFSGCAGSSDAFLIAELYRSSDASVFVSVENSKRAEVLFEECASLVGEEAVSLFPSRDAVPYNMKSPFGPVVENRFKVLSQFLSGVRGIYIAPHPAMLQKVPPPATCSTGLSGFPRVRIFPSKPFRPGLSTIISVVKPWYRMSGPSASGAALSTFIPS
jgi:hypothetical protein